MSAATVTTLVHEPVMSVEQVTPERAQVWLASNRTNRPLRRTKVAQYVRDMVADRWRMTGEAIKFGTDGSLLDGQHRLHAVVKADKPVKMLVITGLESDVMDSLDSGIKRSASDVLGLRGKTNTANLASAARLAIAVQEVGYETASKYPVSTAQISEFIDQNPLVERAVVLSLEHYRRLDIGPAALSYALFRFIQIDDGAAQRFLVAAAHSGGLYNQDPTIALTYRLSEERRSGRRLNTEETLSLLFRAWNDRAAGREVGIYRTKSPKGTIRVPALIGEVNPERWVAKPVA